MYDYENPRPLGAKNAGLQAKIKSALAGGKSLSIGELAAAVGVEVSEVRLPLQQLRAAKLVTRRGKLRAAKYSMVKGAAKKSAKKPAAKKPAAKKPAAKKSAKKPAAKKPAAKKSAAKRSTQGAGLAGRVAKLEQRVDVVEAKTERISGAFSDMRKNLGLKSGSKKSGGKKSGGKSKSASAKKAASTRKANKAAAEFKSEMASIKRESAAAAAARANPRGRKTRTMTVPEMERLLDSTR